MDQKFEVYPVRLTSLSQMLELTFMTDLELCTNDEAKVNIHSIVLGQLGEKCYSKLLSEAKPNKSGMRLDLKKANRDVLIALVDFIYHRQITLEPLTVWKVFEFAKVYNIDCLKIQCFNYLQDRVNAYNCVKIFNESAKIDHPIKSRLDIFFRNSLTKILNDSNSFLSIDYEHFRKLMDDDYLNVQNESIVWQSILKWVNFKKKERSNLVGKLLKTVRYGRLELKYIQTTIATNSIIKSNENVVKFVNEMEENYKKLMENSKDGYNLLANKNIRSIRPRIPFNLILVYGGWKNGVTSESIEIYDCNTNLWFETNIDQVQRSYHGLEFLNGAIYVIGGTDGNDVINSVVRYDPIKRTSRKLASMLEKRCYVSTAVLNDCIYAMGGHNGHQRTDTCERYIPNQNTWIQISPMNIVRSDACAAVYKGKIYIAGGLNPINVENSVEIYNPHNDSWTLVEQMTSPRTSFSLICYNNTLYAIGGNDGYERLSTCEYYNSKRKLWIQIDDMLYRRSTFKATVFNGELYAVAGYNGQSPIRNVEKYSDSTKKWEEVRSLNYDRSGFGVLTITNFADSKLYTFNGNNK